MSIQSRCKDESPIKTVEKIQNILKTYDIETEEQWSESGVKNCYSLRVSVKGTAYGANGKGITKEFARASGYAEFMERLQGGFLVKRLMRENLLDYADEKILGKAECMENCADWLALTAKGLKDLLGADVPIEQIRAKCLESELDDTVVAVPYYNLSRGTTTYFPKKVLPQIYSTNGYAAGNTLEEACVQSLSEIFERHNVIRYFFGSFTPPTIPDEYLQQFEKPYEIIRNLRENGLEVIIKDCSMGEPYPLVAAVAIDKKNHGYHVHMGSHPVFELALERSLTEMFQGRTISGVAATKEFSGANKTMRSHQELLELLTKGCGKYSMNFFAGKPTYEFKPFADRTHMTNTEMLKEFVEYYAKKGYDVFLRDVSHLGFQSVSIVVPGISEAFPHNLFEQFPEGRYFTKYKDAALAIDKLTYPELVEYRNYLNFLVMNHGMAALRIDALAGKCLGGNDVRMSTYYGRIIFTYIEWYFNQENAIRYAKAAATEAKGEIASYLSCLCTYYDYRKAKLDEETIFSGLSILYPQDMVIEVRKALDGTENPFARCVVRCDLSSCDRCMAKDTCNAYESEKLAKKVRRATLAFDHEAAFARLRDLHEAIC